MSGPVTDVFILHGNSLRLTYMHNSCPALLIMCEAWNIKLAFNATDIFLICVKIIDSHPVISIEIFEGKTIQTGIK